MNLLPILTPIQIQQFLNAIQVFEGDPSYMKMTYQVINKLIQTSHNHGHTHFDLDFSDLRPLDAICQGIYQKEDSELTIILRGKLGTWTAQDVVGGTYFLEDVDVEGATGAKNATVYVLHPHYGFFRQSTESKIFIPEIGYDFVTGSVNCTIYSKEGALHPSNNSSESTYYTAEPLWLNAHTNVIAITRAEWDEKWKPAREVFGGSP